MTDGLTGWEALGLPEPPDEYDEPDDFASRVGARVAAARKQRGMTGSQLGAAVRLRKDQISKIESGRRRLDIGELPRVADALGVTVGHLLGMPERPALAVAARLAASAPADALRPATERARRLLEIGDMLTEVTGMPAAQASDAGARVTTQARSAFSRPPSSKADAQREGRELAELARRELDMGSDAIRDVATVIEQHFAADVALSPLGTEADGLCVHYGDSALILASTDFPEGHQRFTLAHELGHHLLDDPSAITVEGAGDLLAAASLQEVRVNAFAGHFLMPERGVRSLLGWLGEPSGQVSERSAVALMEGFGVSMAALVYQLNILGILSFREARRLRALRVAPLVRRHQAVAPLGAATAVTRARRPPQRLERQARASARQQRMGLHPIAALLEREDDQELWDEVMDGVPQLAGYEVRFQ